MDGWMGIDDAGRDEEDEEGQGKGGRGEAHRG